MNYENVCKWVTCICVVASVVLAVIILVKLYDNDCKCNEGYHNMVVGDMRPGGADCSRRTSLNSSDPFVQQCQNMFKANMNSDGTMKTYPNGEPYMWGVCGDRHQAWINDPNIDHDYCDNPDNPPPFMARTLSDCSNPCAGTG